MTEQTMGQIIGIIAAIFVALSYIGKTRSVMLNLQLCAALIFSVHYYLLSAYAGAVVNAIVAARCLVYAVQDKRAWAKSQYWLYAFMIAFLCVPFLTGGTVYSFLPVLGSIMFSISFWLQRPVYIRLFSLIPSSLWCTYAIITSSWGGVLTEGICVIAIICGVLMHDLKIFKMHKVNHSKG